MREQFPQTNARLDGEESERRDHCIDAEYRAEREHALNFVWHLEYGVVNELFVFARIASIDEIFIAWTELFGEICHDPETEARRAVPFIAMSLPSSFGSI